MSVIFLSNIKRNQMKKIKNFAKKLFSAKRMKTLAMLLFCGTLATYAQNAAGDYTAGTDALATVTEEIAKYVPFVVKLCYAIAGVVAVVGAISVYIAMNNEEQDVKKKTIRFFFRPICSPNLSKSRRHGCPIRSYTSLFSRVRERPPFKPRSSPSIWRQVFIRSYAGASW